ncbi:MAG: FAD-dependent oxidoreductase [Candidatus Methylacidiphilales bacterium]
MRRWTHRFWRGNGCGSHGSIRALPTCLMTGHAEGMAAVLAVEQSRKVSEIDAEQIRNGLLRQSPASVKSWLGLQIRYLGIRIIALTTCAASIK